MSVAKIAQQLSASIHIGISGLFPGKFDIACHVLILFFIYSKMPQPDTLFHSYPDNRINIKKKNIYSKLKHSHRTQFYNIFKSAAKLRACLA